MRLILLGTLAYAVLTACAAPETVATTAKDTPSDTVQFDKGIRIFTADTIYTGNPAEPQISGIAVNQAGFIVATLPLGANTTAHTPSGPAEIISFNGTMYPGFVDGHAHLSGIGSRALTLDLAGTASIDELTTHIEAVVFGSPAGQVFYGRGWIETQWPEDRMPTAADLDRAAPDTQSSLYALMAMHLSQTQLQ
jgi:predicted amidohydrolase YtcJ